VYGIADGMIAITRSCLCKAASLLAAMIACFDHDNTFMQ
jgi:hypothetical protein